MQLHRIKLILLIVLIISSFFLVFSSSKTTVENVKGEDVNYVIGYLFTHNKNLNDIRWNALTHVNLAFIYANEDGSISDSHFNNSIKQIVEEAHKNNVKVLVSLRDDDSAKLVYALANNREKLVENLLQYARENSLDGIDFDFEDWEREGVIPHLLNFAEEFHLKKDKDLLFTCAVNTWDRGYTNNWHKWFDIINVMTYDVHGPWNNEGQHSPYEESFEAIEFWMNILGAPSEKLALGLPFYGYSWNDGDQAGQSYTYADIVDKYPNEDVAAKDNIERLYYNGKETIKKKTQWAKDNNLGGVMIWQIKGDAVKEDDSLLKAIGEIMRNK